MKKKCKKRLDKLAIDMANRAILEVESGLKKRINAIWLETSGCFGEVISLLDSEDPDVIYMLKKFVNIEFFGSIMGDQDGRAYERILELINNEFIFIVCGAVPTKDDGLYATIATYAGKRITAMDVVKNLGEKAKYIVTIGTCASFGGPTAGKPNESKALSISEFLNRKDIINIPGCPANPVWTMGVLGYLTSVGIPKLDINGRPIAYYGETIHDNCPRRKYFDSDVFAQKFGEKECMFLLGCRGPITYAYCPISRWNESDNWPIGDNTTCIGCADPKFPDGTEPFVKYGGETR
ncbi:hydrogenase small subunit [Clostridioides difficile]